MALLPSQPSSAENAVTCAMEIIDTASNPNLSKGLSTGQPRLDEMALDAAAAAFGDLVLGKVSEEAGRGPASVSDYSANRWHGTLTAGSRNSLRDRLSRAVSTVLFVLMRHLRSGRHR
nr:hypothetical protein [Bradyrhizobium cytisi]